MQSLRNSLATTLVLALLLALPLTITTGCSSSKGGGQSGGSDGGNQTNNEPPPMPDWIMNPPNDPGVAYYGVGQGSFKSAISMQRAIQDASTKARRAIADSIRTRVEGLTKSYARQILTAEGDVSEESFSQDVTRTVTQSVLTGATIDKVEVIDKDADTHIVYALAKISHEDVARSLYETMTEFPIIATYDEVEKDLMRGVTLDPNQSNLPEPGDPTDPGPGLDPDPTDPTPEPEVGNGNGNTGQPTGNGNTGQPTGNGGNTGQPTQPTGNNGNTGHGNTNPRDNGPRQVNPDRARRWLLDREDPEYPKSRFLIGVGSGGTVRQAENSARADLASFFKVKIEGVTETWSSSETRLQRGELEVTEVVRSIDSVRATVNQTLRGAKVAGTCRIDGQWTVLVVLEISVFLRDTASRIDQLEREVGDGLNSARRSAEARAYLSAIRTLADCYRNAREAIALVELYNLIARNARSARYSLAQIEDMVLEMGRKVTVVFRIKAVTKWQDGREEEGGEGTVIDQVTGKLRQDRNGMTVRRPTADLDRVAVSELARMGRNSLQRIMPDTAFVVFGTVTTQYSGQAGRGRFQKYTTTWELTALDVYTGYQFQLSNVRGTSSTSTDDRIAAAGALSKAALAISQELARKLRG